MDAGDEAREGLVGGEAPPKDYAALRALMAQKADSLPKRLMQVAGFAMENPDDVAFGTVASIAASADVQPSALVRFAHALGYQGFTELQDVFRSRLRDRVLNYDERLARMRDLPTSRSGIVLDGFLDAAQKSIAQFRGKADHDAVERAVALMAQAETIYLIGLRRSFPITSYMSYALGKLAVRNVLIDAVAGMGVEQASFISPRDAVVSVSFAPYAAETVTLTRAARSRGASIVTITDSIFSPIAPPADVMIEIAEADFEGFRSMAATFALAMTLCVSVAARRGEAG